MRINVSPGSTAHPGFAFDELERVAPFLFTLLENTPDFICLIAPDGVVHFVNRVVAGLTMVDVIGHSLYKFCAPESRETLRACLRRVVETGEPGFFESTGLGPDGATVRYESRIGPIRQNGAVIALLLVATDITCRIEMERRLRDSRDRLEVAVAASGIGLWELDLVADEVVWDDNMLRIHRRTAADRPLRSRDLFALIHPDDRDRVEAKLAEARETGELTDLEYRVILPEGQVARILARGKGIRDAGGRVVKLLGGLIDVTAGRQADEALRHSEARYRSLVEVLKEGIVLQRADGAILTCNTSAEQILGLTADQMMGMTSLDPRWRAIHEDGSPFPGDTHPAMVTLRTGTPQSGVIMGVHKPSGQLTWISINSQPLFFSEASVPDAVVCSFFDITAHKLAEAEMERLLRDEQGARRRAVLLAEASKLLASSLDVAGALADIVRRLVPELADLAVVELLDDDGRFGTSHIVLAAADDSELATSYLELRRRRAVDDANPLVDLLRRREVRLSAARPTAPPTPLPGLPDDEELALRMSYRSTMLVPLAARDVPLGVLILAARTRHFGPDDLALAEDLALRAGQAIDTSRAYSEMELALARREEFIAVAAHELRTPLTPLMLQSERLLQQATGRRDGPCSPEAVVPALRVIHRQTERLHRLIEELLDVSQITGGRLEIETEDVDFAELVRDLVARFAGPLARAGCELRLTAPDHAPGRTDRTRWEQIVSNLLANAMKYGPGKPIEIALAVEPDAVQLSVRDHGIGISPKDQARIFQRFERAVSERHYGGLGLGLWVTRHVAEAMGGGVSVTSAPGLGSTFVVRLPRTLP